jgi:hypothetical protein
MANFCRVFPKSMMSFLCTWAKKGCKDSIFWLAVGSQRSAVNGQRSTVNGQGLVGFELQSKKNF